MSRLVSFEEFHDGCPGGHLGFRDRVILAMLSIYVALMPPTKFWFNIMWCGRRYLFKNFKMVAKVAILDFGTEYFSNAQHLHCILP